MRASSGEGICPVEPERRRHALPPAAELLRQPADHDDELRDLGAAGHRRASASDTEAAPVGCSQPALHARRSKPSPPPTSPTPPRACTSTSTCPRKPTKTPKDWGRPTCATPRSPCRRGWRSTPPRPTASAPAPWPRSATRAIRKANRASRPSPPTAPTPRRSATVEIDAPLVDHPLPGAVYLAKQTENPFGSLLAIYIAVNDPQTGVVVKLPGKVETDPVTRPARQRLRAEPAAALRRLQGRFLPRRPSAAAHPADLRGIGERSELHHHDLADPLDRARRAHRRTPATPSRSPRLPAGGPCAATKAALPNAPSFEAGTANPLAGAY